jgi:hypothetical protein
VTAGDTAIAVDVHVAANQLAGSGDWAAGALIKTMAKSEKGNRSFRSCEKIARDRKEADENVCPTHVNMWRRRFRLCPGFFHSLSHSRLG